MILFKEYEITLQTLCLESLELLEQAIIQMMKIEIKHKTFGTTFYSSKSHLSNVQ